MTIRHARRLASSPPRTARTLALSATLVLAVACASSGAGNGGTAAPPSPGKLPNNVPRVTNTWPVKTRENVDLWLHGFALLTQDTTRVPLFRRGYRDDLTVLKNRANVITQLDVNADKLRDRLRADPSLVNAQFVPFYFSSVDDMRAAIDRFIQVNGSPQGARNAGEQAAFAVLASYFTTAQNRQWLSLFASALWDEDTKFYHSYWMQQQRERANVIDSVSGMWQHRVRPALQPVLTNSRQRDGDLILSLPLDGEGRTVSGAGGARNAIAVTFPERPSDAPEAMYVVAHEVIGSIAAAVIVDNTTPAQQRDGTADRMQSPAAVRGGLMLLEHVLPDLADGYARYYLRSAGRTPGRDPRAELAALFPIPETIRAGIARQLDAIKSGI